MRIADGGVCRHGAGRTMVGDVPDHSVSGLLSNHGIRVSHVGVRLGTQEQRGVSQLVVLIE